MKNKISLLLLAVFAMVLFYSCSTAHKVQGVQLNGLWTLDKVTIEGSESTDQLKTTLFNDVSSICLENSVWNLPANGQGSYTVSSTLPGCNAGARQIYWSVKNNNGNSYFQFKKIDADVKPKDVTEGYQMQIRSITNNQMELQSPVENDNLTIIYHFSKK